MTTKAAKEVCRLLVAQQRRGAHLKKIEQVNRTKRLEITAVDLENQVGTQGPVYNAKE